jgi:hypothetical protein
MRSLFKTIEGLVQLTMEVVLRSIFKTRRLSHVYIFLENTMQEHVLNIQLEKALPLRDNNTTHKMNCSKLNNRAKGVIIINAISLFQVFGDKTSFIAI